MDSDEKKTARNCEKCTVLYIVVSTVTRQGANKDLSAACACAAIDIDSACWRVLLIFTIIKKSPLQKNIDHLLYGLGTQARLI